MLSAANEIGARVLPWRGSIPSSFLMFQIEEDLPACDCARVRKMVNPMRSKVGALRFKLKGGVCGESLSNL